MKRQIVVGTLLVIQLAQARASVEIWECKEQYGVSDDILAKATIDEGRKTGSIFVAGVDHNTSFEVAGFDRRWDFDPDENGKFKYSFIIRPNGEALYFDFSASDSSRPSQLMKCKQRETESPEKSN